MDYLCCWETTEIVLTLGESKGGYVRNEWLMLMTDTVTYLVTVLQTNVLQDLFQCGIIIRVGSVIVMIGCIDMQCYARIWTECSKL